jgi:hypothetical protein
MKHLNREVLAVLTIRYEGYMAYRVSRGIQAKGRHVTLVLL